MHLRKLVLLLTLPLLCFTSQAQAVALELGIGFDESGSITPVEFLAIKNGLINALSDAALLPHDGSIAVGIWLFSYTPRQVFTTAAITDTNFADLIAMISGLTQRGGASGTGPAIDAIATDLLGNSIDSDKQIIQIITDGSGNYGRSDAIAAADAVAAGIEHVNCLSVKGYMPCTAVAGPDSLADRTDDGRAPTAAVHTAAIDDKIHADLTLDLAVPSVDVPEPGSLALAGLALAGLAVARRKRA